MCTFPSTRPCYVHTMQHTIGESTGVERQAAHIIVTVLSTPPGKTLYYLLRLSTADRIDRIQWRVIVIANSSPTTEYGRQANEREAGHTFIDGDASTRRINTGWGTNAIEWQTDELRAKWDHTYGC